MTPKDPTTEPTLPLTQAALKEWIHTELRLPATTEQSLLTAIDAVVGHHDSLVSELQERASRDPKTKLVNFEHFMLQLEAVLKLGQRGRWCAVGLADINDFKRYNDSLGHAIGDRIIGRVAQLLREHIRSHDVVTGQLADRAEDLHARFGGDEFCFMIPSLMADDQAFAIAERFRVAVEQDRWEVLDPRLAKHPVRVDVGLVCVSHDAVMDRQAAGRHLCEKLIETADLLMYEGKLRSSTDVLMTVMKVDPLEFDSED